jgi:hypothetical protein
MNTGIYNDLEVLQKFIEYGTIELVVFPVKKRERPNICIPLKAIRALSGLKIEMDFFSVDGNKLFNLNN